MYWIGNIPNLQTTEHDLPLSTQAEDQSSIKTSRGEDGPEESNDEVDDAEDDNDPVNLINYFKISVPET